MRDAASPRPWKRTRTGEESDFTILRIREDRFADPRDGREHPRVILTAPDWVNVVALTPERDALLVRQFRFGVGANSLEIPGGMVDPGETPAGAAASELEEETGFRAASWVTLGKVHPNPALQGNQCHSYLALGCRRYRTAGRGRTRTLKWCACRQAAWKHLVQDGTITHALVVTAVYFAARLGALEGK